MRARYTFEALEARVFLAATHFAVIGDFGNNSAGEADVAARVKTWNPDYVVTVGDNSYPSGLASELDPNIGQYYHEFIKYPAGSSSIYATLPGQPVIPSAIHSGLCRATGYEQPDDIPDPELQGSNSPRRAGRLGGES